LKSFRLAGGALFAALVLAGMYAAVTLASAVPEPPGTARCSVPEELSRVDFKLPGLGATLKSRRPIRIVAIGGGSTAGAAAGSADLAYPHRLEQALSRLWPTASITVVNMGVPRQTAEQMVARFAADVFPARPDLVIWETGIVDAVRGIDIDEFATALQRGIDQLKAHHIDMVLVDMQFSRKAAAVIDFDQYLGTLHEVGEANGVYVFPRFAIMRYWSEQNVFDFEEVDPTRRKSLAAAVYGCIGQRLADAIRVAAR
jgi:acyl-CoA thioesterase-1